MIGPHEYLRCVGDSYTQVRDVQGRLLGCIPRIADNVEGIRASDGTPYPIRIAAVACLCVPDDVDPRTLPQFTPLDLSRNADLALPPRVEP
jgi:hypothetical protein